jgi:hypothetical protein
VDLRLRFDNGRFRRDVQRGRVIQELPDTDVFLAIYIKYPYHFALLKLQLFS